MTEKGFISFRGPGSLREEEVLEAAKVMKPLTFKGSDAGALRECPVTGSLSPVGRRQKPPVCYANSRITLSIFPMTVIVKSKTGLVVPPSVQRKAGIRSGDRLEFSVSSNTITIAPARPATYRPTKSELAAIRKGESAIARGECVSLTDFLHGLDSNRRKAGTKTSREVSR